MIPALFTNTSIAGTSAHPLTVAAASRTAERDSRSSCRVRTLTAGCDLLMVSAVAVSLKGVRPARTRSEGEARAISWTKKAPRPPGEQPVVRTTLPVIWAARSLTRTPAVVWVSYGPDIIAVEREGMRS